MRTMSLRAHRILTGVVAGFVIVTSAVAVTARPGASAQAEATGTRLGHVTVSPNTGTWDMDPSNVSMEGDYTCSPVGPYTQLSSAVFIAESGHEEPAIPEAGVDTGAGSEVPYPLSLAAGGGTIDSFGAAQPSAGVFPGIWDGWPNWALGDGTQLTSTADVLDHLDASKSYSLVVACTYAKNSSLYLLPDASGHVMAAWSPLKLSADKLTWTVPSPSSIALTATASGDSGVTLAATLTSGGTAATGASGSVEFSAAGTPVGTATVANGAASQTLTGLTSGATYSYTATYTPDAASTFDGATSTAVAFTVTPTTTPTPTPTPTTTPGTGTELTAGATMTAGTAYTVTAPAGTFTAADTVKGEIHSDPIALKETAVAAADGGTVYAFTAPSGVPAGSHELVLTDAHGATYRVAFTVAAASGGGGGGGGNGTQTTGTNTPVSFATDWIGGMASTPGGLAGLFGILLALIAVAVAAWNYFWRRRDSLG